MTPVLTNLAPLLELAMLKRAVVPDVNWSSSVNRLPFMPFGGQGVHPGRPLDFVRHLEGERIPDAYGVQLLTDRHMAHIDDLASWDVRDVAPNRCLVSSRSLSRWFSGSEPDAGVLTGARASFGEVIMAERQLMTQAPWGSAAPKGPRST